MMQPRKAASACVADDHPVGAGLRQEIRALQVGPQHVLEALFGGFQDVGTDLRGHAGVVHQHVQAAETLPRPPRAVAAGRPHRRRRPAVEHLGARGRAVLAAPRPRRPPRARRRRPGRSRPWPDIGRCQADAATAGDSATRFMAYSARLSLWSQSGMRGSSLYRLPDLQFGHVDPLPLLPRFHALFGQLHALGRLPAASSGTARP